MNFDVNYSKLASGVRVLAVPISGAGSVTAMVLVRTGPRNETEKQAGISHILEHMLMKATRKFPEPQDLARAIDSLGAEHNAFTGKEFTGYYITAAAEKLSASLAILSDCLNNSLLAPKHLETERTVIVEEYRMFQDQPMRRAGEEFENLMYEGTSMGRFIEGTPETILATTSEDLREYMRSWYCGGNVLIVVAGESEQVKKYTSEKMLDPYFGELPVGKIMPFKYPPRFGAAKNRHIEKKTEQAHFVMGVPGISMQDPRRYALHLAETILGGSMSSRLFNELREKRGIAYYVSADADFSYDIGHFSVRAGVRLDKLSEAMEAVRTEMTGLGRSITQEELARAKDYLLGRLPLSLETSMDVAQYLGFRALIADEIRQPEQVVESVAKVTIDDVKNVLKAVVKESEIRTVVVGPASA